MNVYTSLQSTLTESYRDGVGLRVELSEGFQIRLIAGVLRVRCPAATEVAASRLHERSQESKAYSVRARWTSTCHGLPRLVAG